MSGINPADVKSSHVPFLARFAVARSAGETLPGGYDSATSLWTVYGPEGRVPLIAHRADWVELLTKTRVQQESDDTDIPLLELTTKTEENDSRGSDRAVLGWEQEQFEIVRGLYQPKTATADLMMMPPYGLRRI